MNRKIILTGSFIMMALVLLYNRELLFYFQLSRLKKHLLPLNPVVGKNLRYNRHDFHNSLPYSKVWAHRVNTPERFGFLFKHFEGFEMDIVFDEQRNVLDIRHPPAASIDLSFERYLEVPGAGIKYFWLDVKNLTSANVQAFLSCLQKLDSRYHIRHRIIVESGNIAELGKISAAGFFTSYYYSWNSYAAFTGSGNKKDQDSVFNLIDAVSQDQVMYDTLVKRFPSKPRLTWALSFRNYFSDSLFKALDRDERLLVYLVNIKSPGYR